MFDALLDRTLSVSRLATSKDAGGGTVRTASTIATGIAGAVQPASSYTIESYMRRNVEVDSKVYTTADLKTILPGGLKLGDIFVDSDGTKYVVKGGIIPQQNAIISSDPLYQVDCKTIS